MQSDRATNMGATLELKPRQILAADQILTFAQADAVRVYGDLSAYCVRLALEPDGWHVDYELRDPQLKGGGPHYVLDPVTGAILSKRYEQ